MAFDVKPSCKKTHVVHMQKYRSHRKHLLAREAEAASWTRRRQMYPKKDVNPWLAPTIGFPPPPPQPAVRPFRPLHVWGHPTAEAHMWLRRPVPPSPSLPWAPQPPLPPPPDPSYWSHLYQRVRTSLSQRLLPSSTPNRFILLMCREVEKDGFHMP
ncbi:hypothetical protein BHM03_00021192 [Ensete ventricosum]|nr:hypothetical protein BHM03_00021192 [Ensete ventricosum]